LAAILACGLSLSASVGARAEVPVVKSFQADAKLAKTEKKPIMVLFFARDCHFCERVLHEWLEPMSRDKSYTDRVLLRRVEVGGTARIKDFAGKPITQGEFASFEGVFMVPTIKVFDASGKEVSEPIIGLLTPDFYGGYLDQAIQAGVDKLRGKP
jgi:thioredoxin-related protein